MKVVITMLIAILLPLGIIPKEATAQEGEPWRKETSHLSETARVKKALIGFIYGIQHNMPSITREYAVPDSMLRALPNPQKREEVYDAAIRSMKGVGNTPIVILANPRITFHNGKAFVDCHLIWHFRNENNEIIALNERERFTLVNQGSGYRIIESTLVPIILTQCSSRQSLENALHEGTVREGICE